MKASQSQFSKMNKATKAFILEACLSVTIFCMSNAHSILCWSIPAFFCCPDSFSWEILAIWSWFSNANVSAGDPPVCVYSGVDYFKNVSLPHTNHKIHSDCSIKLQKTTHVKNDMKANSNPLEPVNPTLKLESQALTHHTVSCKISLSMAVPTILRWSYNLEDSYYATWV